MSIIKIEKLFLLIIAVSFIGCSNPPRMNRGYDYLTDKYEALDICKNVLQELEYEIDIYAPESYMLTTKPTQLRKVLRKYDYIIYLKVTDRINVHISAERNIINRGSESSLGGSSIIIKQTETYLPASIQMKIFEPIHKNLMMNDFKEL